MEKKMFLVLIFCLFAVVGFEGCATTSTTTKTETVTTYDTKGDSIERSETAPTSEEPSTTKVEKRTEVEEKQTESESGGILSTTLDVVGNVLAFPFKVIAGVIEFVF